MTNIQLLEIIPGKPIYVVSLIILTLIILKILSVQRIVKTERILKKIVKEQFEKYKFEEFPDNKNDKLYNQLRGIDGFIDFNIINRKNDTLLIKFNDSKRIVENNHMIKQHLSNNKMKINENIKFTSSTHNDLIFCINKNLFLVFSFSKLNCSQIFEKN